MAEEPKEDAEARGFTWDVVWLRVWELGSSGVEASALCVFVAAALSCSTPNIRKSRLLLPMLANTPKALC